MAISKTIKAIASTSLLNLYSFILLTTSSIVFAEGSLKVDGTISGNGAEITGVDAETLGRLTPSEFATETELATPGDSEVHWGNITNVPRQAVEHPSRGTLQVFGTSAEYNGASAPGFSRLGMNNACRTEDPESHFCTIQEIENVLRTTGVAFLSHGALWVDNMILGSLSETYNGNWVGSSDWTGGSGGLTDYPLNCGGWRSNGAGDYGYSVNTGGLSPSLGTCDRAHSIACCK